MDTKEPRTSSLPYGNPNNEAEKRPCVLAVGLGEVLWDLLPEGPALGGAPANFAHACKALGAHSTVVSTIGNDELGKKTREELTKLGIQPTSLTTDDEHPTGTVDVAIGASGSPTYTFPANVAWDFLKLPENAQLLAKTADIVAFGTLAQRNIESRRAILHFLAMTTKRTLKVFDVNIRGDNYSGKIIRDSLYIADVVKLNSDELKIVCEATGLHMTNEADVLYRLINNYALKAVALTKGTTGSVVATPDKRSVLTSFRVNVVDTVGAGDSFAAAFSLGFHQNWDLDKAHRKAAVVASYVCTQQGAMPEFPEGLRMIHEASSCNK